jgi:hypothetical protein
MIPVVPSSAMPIADKGGFVTTVWQRFFNAIVSQAEAITQPRVIKSPFQYQASGQGNLVVSGGTVSDISLRRGTMTLPMGIISGVVPMSNLDVVTITFTGAPDVAFVPA